MWDGEGAKEKGLVDEVGSMVQVLAERHPEATLDIEPDRRNILKKIMEG